MTYSQNDMLGLAGFGALVLGIGLVFISVFAMSLAALTMGVAAILLAAFVAADKKERAQAIIAFPILALLVGTVIVNPTWGLYFLGATLLVAFMVCLFRHTFLTVFCIWLGLNN
jgi:hypothetical protein